MGESGALWDASQRSKPRFLFAHVPFARPGADWLGCAVTEDPVARTVPIRWLISAGSFPVRDDEGKRDLLTEDVIWKVLRGQGIREKNVKILGLACDRHHVRFADRWWVGRVFLAGGAPTRCGRGSAGHVRDVAPVGRTSSTPTRGLPFVELRPVSGIKGTRRSSSSISPRWRRCSLRQVASRFHR